MRDGSGNMIEDARKGGLGKGGRWAGGTLGSESKEMALESQTWKSQMGLELVSLIYGLRPLVLPLVNF